MTLRSKATLVVSTSFLALVGFLLAAALVVLLGRFRLLEADEAGRNAQRALDALNDQGANLAATVGDWAHWDDSAAFVTGRNPGFSRVNLTDDTFMTLRLDVVAFLGPGGRIVYRRVYDRAGHHDAPPPEGLADLIAPGSPLVTYAEAASHREGLVVLPRAILLAASQPVTDSLRRGPAVGVLVFARILDAPEMKRLSTILQNDVRLSTLDSAGLTTRQMAEAASAEAEAAEPRPFIVTHGADRIDAILPLRDVAGKLTAALDVQGARRVYRHGLLSIVYLGGSLIACSALSAVLLWLLLSRMVLSPLAGLSRAVRGIGATGGTGRLAARGRDELSEVAHSINGMLDALATSETRRGFLEERLSHVHKLEAIGTLAGGVAHDFNNILMAITGFCDLLEDSSRQARPEVEEIRKAAARAASLTSQLLAFSRRQRLQFRVLDLNGLLSDMAGMLQRLLGEHLALELTLEPNLARIRGDFGQLQQVIMNLAVNARDAMPGGGMLSITTKTVTIGDPQESDRIGLPNGAYVRCSVRDTGIGMREDVRARIFEPFFTTKELGSGTGLGLSVVWGIVKQCDGTISVTSAPGQGSTFDIYLPVTAQETELEGEQAAAIPASCSDAPGTGTVLVVEDEGAIRRFLSQALRKAGYCVLEAADGEEALARAAEHGPDGIRLLLTDVVMPRMGGTALARVLMEQHPGMKVLFMSGNAELQVTVGASEPILPLLQKPFNTRQLVQSVAAVLGD